LPPIWRKWGNCDFGGLGRTEPGDLCMTVLMDFNSELAEGQALSAYPLVLRVTRCETAAEER
jgi:hypothetical protein